MDSYCECGNKKIKSSKTCQKCYLIYRNPFNIGNNFGYRKSLKHYFCKDCGEEINRKTFIYGSKRCLICNGKLHSKRMKGKNNPMFGKKRPELSKKFKGHVVSKDTRNKLRISHLGKKHTQKTRQLMSEQRKGINNSNYKNGLSHESYPFQFNDQLRNQIRKRDNYICQNCSMTEKKHAIVYNKKLHVHHIDYNKDNCKEDNLITLCQKCNSNANGNRDYWYSYFKYIIGEK